MKKSLLALAALTAFAGVASAQSSVTLFGIVDLAARNVKNGTAGDISSLSHSGNATNRLGFRGVEDLGGGLKAGFHIEGELQPDTGNAGGQNWQRRSTVSLMGGFGEVRLGRDYTATFWNHTTFDPFGTNGVGNSLNLMTMQSFTAATVTAAELSFIPNVSSATASAAQQAADKLAVINTVLGTPVGSGATTLVRANNMIGYFLPAMGGLYGQLQVAAGEGVLGNKYIGGRLGYAAGPINVAAAYGVTEMGGAATTPAGAAAAGFFQEDLKAWNIGASFKTGFATFMGQYHSYEADVEQTLWLVGATVPMGSGTFKVSYAEAGKDVDATQMAFGYVYDLSKRTALYAHYARIDNEVDNRFVIGGGPTTGGFGFKSTGYEFGVRHSF